MAEEATSDAQGNFTINESPDAAKPNMIRTTYQGVGYIHMLPPGSPATGLTLDVYESSKQPGAAKVSKHMILFQPAGGQLTVNETYILDNNGKTSWNDPAGGALHFCVPADADGKAEVNATAADAGGMGIGAELIKGSAPGVFGVDFPVKPGETRVDIDYTVPYTEGAPYAGKIVSKDENTYLMVPNGVSHCRGQAERPGPGAADASAHLRAAGDCLQDPTDRRARGSGRAGCPGRGFRRRFRQRTTGGSRHAARFRRRLYLILGLALGILALGFAILYRASGTVKENDERGRG